MPESFGSFAAGPAGGAREPSFRLFQVSLILEMMTTFFEELCSSLSSKSSSSFSGMARFGPEIFFDVSGHQTFQTSLSLLQLLILERTGYDSHWLEISYSVSDVQVTAVPRDAELVHGIPSRRERGQRGGSDCKRPRHWGGSIRADCPWQAAGTGGACVISITPTS